MPDQVANVLYSVRSFLEAQEGLGLLLSGEPSTTATATATATASELVAAVASSRGLNCAVLLKLILRSLSAHNPALVAMHARPSETALVGEGAFGTVYRVRMEGSAAHTCESSPSPSPSPSPSLSSSSSWCIVKTVPRGRSIHDSAGIVDMYYETMCLLRLKERGCKGSCDLLDFGTTDKAYFLVLENGKFDLLQWRQQQTGEGRIAQTDRAGLYLLLMVDALKVVAQAHANGVVHFDVKCNNFLLRADPEDPAARRTLLKVHGVHDNPLHLTLPPLFQLL
jgi:hypothetical protein